MILKPAPNKKSTLGGATLNPRGLLPVLAVFSNLFSLFIVAHINHRKGNNNILIIISTKIKLINEIS